VSLDLVLWAATKADLATWGQTNPPNRPLREQVIDTPAVLDDEGNVTTPATYKWQIRKGLEFSWWNGSGNLMLEPRTFRTTVNVDIVQDPRFGFDAVTVPAWATRTEAVVDGEVIGTYDRTTGNTVVFMATGDLPEVGDEVDIYTTTQFVDGQFLLLRIHGEFFDADEIHEGNDVEPWERSRVAKYIKNNGTEQTVQGLTCYEMEGVRIFRYADVLAWCEARGVPGHTYL